MKMITVDVDENVVLTKSNYKKIILERDKLRQYMAELIDREELLHRKMNGAFLFLTGHLFYKDEGGDINETQ